MAGPLTLALMYTSIEKGGKAGIVLGAGIWLSDLIYILLAFFGFKYILKLEDNEAFNYSVGIIGSVVLIAIGIGILIKKTASREELRPKKLASKDVFTLFSQGFAINTFNPVAVIFWSSVMGAVVIERSWNTIETTIFFIGTFVCVVASDILKIILAKYITKWLNAKRWQFISKISGYLFIIFGIALLLRVAFG